jgi:recombination protein RecT
METKTDIITTKELFSQENIRKKFVDMLGKKAQGFITSVLQIVASNELLKKADPNSVYNAAAVAATLDLPLNNNLGFAYIVPYNAKQKDGTYKQVAQFQMGYKGFIQLAQRTGLFKTISAAPIFEGQLIEQNPLTGFVFDFTKKKSETIIGYAAYFQLLNGFEKTLFMSAPELVRHGSKYSQTFKKGYGLWKDDFEAMCIKTVIKLLLARFAPLSIEMQKAVITDQAVVNDNETTDVTYADNDTPEIDKEAERIVLLIGDAKTLDDLNAIEEHVQFEQMDLFMEKKNALTKKK